MLSIFIRELYKVILALGLFVSPAKLTIGVLGLWIGAIAGVCKGTFSGVFAIKEFWYWTEFNG